MKRSAGILNHISSLPSPWGIGTFGKEAYAFADFLREAHQSFWQVLPLGPTSYGDSPYQSFSTYALNPYFIDLDLLVDWGLLSGKDMSAENFGDDPAKVDYEKLYLSRIPLLKKAYDHGCSIFEDEFSCFTERHKFWVEDYGFYMALKEQFDMKSWLSWPKDLRDRNPETLSSYRERLASDICFWKFLQFLAYRQWQDLKAYVNRQGIQIIGDIPIYAPLDSADVWCRWQSGIFKFDAAGRPTAFSGCPPDAFSDNGQFWGTPVYDWEKNKETGYSWWLSRIENALAVFDWVRIDHFRGFEAYWEIPADAETAATGRWIQGPGMEFINTLERSFGRMNIIAEDLGYHTEGLAQFLEQSGYPGMKVLQFAFDSDRTNSHLLHRHVKNSVVYTGTHDNDTTLGWMASADPEKVAFAKDYLHLSETEGYHWGFIKAALSSVSDLAVIPVQDLLGQGGECRMNRPAVIGGNWQYRLLPGQLDDRLAKKLADLTDFYDRSAQ